jgi:DNA-binding response OmpR family regulator
LGTTGTILIVEDDAAIRRGLVDAVRFAGYDVLETERGDEAVHMALECPVDLVLLDVMLPGCDGFEVLGEVRKARPTLPVIMVTARGAEEDRVRGLLNGADDYVTKPFSATELLARVAAVMRRSPERPADVDRLVAGDLTIDLARQEVHEPGAAVRPLTGRDVDVLRYLAQAAGRAVDRDELLHRVWGLDPRGLSTRTVDMHIARLREKLGGDGGDLVRTVRGKGYMLDASVRIGGVA